MPKVSFSRFVSEFATHSMEEYDRKPYYKQIDLLFEYQTAHLCQAVEALVTDPLNN